MGETDDQNVYKCTGANDGLFVRTSTNHDGSFLDPQETSCAVGARYRYTTLDENIVTNAILVVSDWRYTILSTTDTAITDSRSSLTFYFTNVHPDPKGDWSGNPLVSGGSEGLSNALSTAKKLELGQEAHSQWLNLDVPHWGKYLILKVQCENPSGTCLKTKLMYVNLFDQGFYERADFENHDDQELIDKYGEFSSVAKSKQSILPHKFRTNCSYYGIGTSELRALHGCYDSYTFTDGVVDIPIPHLDAISEPSVIWLKTADLLGLSIGSIVIVPAIKESGADGFVQRDLDRTTTRVLTVGYATYDNVSVAPQYIESDLQQIQFTAAWPYYAYTTNQAHTDPKWYGEVGDKIGTSSADTQYSDTLALATDLYAYQYTASQSQADKDTLMAEWKYGQTIELTNLSDTHRVTDLAVISLPVSQNHYAISGILIQTKEQGACSTVDMCNDAKCVRFISGDTSDMTKSLSDPDEQFTWLISIPETCRNRLTIQVSGHGTDDNSLFKSESTSYWWNTSDNKLATDMNVDILYNSNANDPTKARSQTVTLQVDILYTDPTVTTPTPVPILTKTRTLVYTNPCDTADFFTEVTGTVPLLHTFYHILGVIGTDSIQTIDVDPLFPDQVSNGLGSTDNYTFCKSLRKYELLAAVVPADPLDKRADFTLLGLKTEMVAQFELDGVTPKYETDSGGTQILDADGNPIPLIIPVEKFESQISAALLAEFFFEVTVKVSTEIAATEVDSYERKIALYGRTCIKRANVLEYPTDAKTIQIRQNSWDLAKPTYTWQLVFTPHTAYESLCTGPYDEKLYFIEKDSGGVETVLQTFPEDLATYPGGLIPAGVTVDPTTLKVTILTTKAMISGPDPAFKSNFFIKHEVQNWYSGTSKATDTPPFDAGLLGRTESQTIEILIVDNCNDSAVSAITPFTVTSMQTSVLRVITEYDVVDALSLHDIRQDITNDAAVTLFSDQSTVWNNQICGNLVVDVTHDGATADFAAYSYTYLSVATDHWITLAPTLNSQVGDYTMTFTIKFEETDYPDITSQVTLAIEVLPCEIKSTVDDTVDLFLNPYTYTIVQDKSALTVNTKKFVFEPQCVYQHAYSLAVTPTPVLNQDASFYNMPATSDIVTVNSDNLWNRGDYEFKMTLTLTDYASTVGTNIYERTFNVELIDPCRSTNLLASESGVIHLHTLVDHGSKLTYAFANYYDTVSLDEDAVVAGSFTVDQVIGRELCGPREFKIVALITNAQTQVVTKFDAGTGLHDYVTLDSETSVNTNTLTYHTTKQQNKGAHLIEVQANLQNYTSIKNDTLQFNVTFYKLNSDISLNDLKYVLEEESVNVTIPLPRFIPPLHTTPELTDSSGFGDGAVILYGVRFRNGKEEWISPIPPEVMIHDAENGVLVINSLAVDYIGYNKVEIWYDFQDYMNDNSLQTDFSLLILPSPKNAPEGGVKPQFDFRTFSPIQNVIFGDPWSIALPETYHPDDTDEQQVQIFYETVDIGGTSFLNYDQDQQTLSIEPGDTSELDVGSYEIKMRLQDFLGVLSPWQTITINVQPPPEEKEIVDDAETNLDVEIETETDQIDESIGLKFALQLKEQKEREQLIAAGVDIEDIETPTAKFKSIDDLGSVVIEFSQDMRINTQVKEAKTGGTILFEGAKEPVSVDKVLKVRLVPFYEAQNDKLGYSWYVQDIGSRQIRIKVVFENPIFVSPSVDRDSLEVIFVDGLYFQGPSIKNLDSKTTLEREIPKQTGDVGTKAALQQAAGVLNSGTQITMLANIGINALQASSLQYLWDMINAQQIVILTPLFYITIPDNAMIFFGWLMQIAAMEAIPTDLIYEQVSQIEGNPMNDKFEEIGFEHHLVLNNFGTLGFVLAILPFLYLLHACTNIFQGIRCCRKFSKKLGNKLYYSIVLRTIIESYVIGLICTFVGIINMDFSRNDNWTYINSIVAYMMLVLFGIFPFWGVYFLLRNWSNLQHINFEGRFGELTEGYNIKDKKMLIFWGLDYARKCCLALTVTFTLTHLWLQMFVLYMFSVALIIAAGHLDARKSRFDRQMDIFNEAKLIIIMYHLMLFTDYVPSPVTQEYIGFSCSGVLIGGTAINMGMLILTPIKAMQRYCRVRGHKKRAKRIAAQKHFKKSAQGFNKRKIEKYKQQQEKVKAQILEIEKIKQDQTHKERTEKERHEKLTELHEKAMEQKKRRAERIADRLHHAGRPKLSEKIEYLNLVDRGDGNNNIAKVNERLLAGKRPLITDIVKNSEVNNETEPADNAETRIEATQMSMADFGSANELVERNNEDTTEQPGLIFPQEQSKSFSKAQQRRDSELVISEDNSSVQQDAYGSDEDGEEPVIQKLTWDDLDYLWSKFKIGVSDIQTIPGFQNFEVTDTVPIGALNLDELFAQQQQQKDLAFSDAESSSEQQADDDDDYYDQEEEKSAVWSEDPESNLSYDARDFDSHRSRPFTEEDHESRVSDRRHHRQNRHERNIPQHERNIPLSMPSNLALAGSKRRNQVVPHDFSSQGRETDLDIYDAERRSGQRMISQSQFSEISDDIMLQDKEYSLPQFKTLFKSMRDR